MEKQVKLLDAVINTVNRSDPFHAQELELREV